MFAYLRYFSIISAIIITMAAIALGYYFRSSAGADLRELVIKNNKVLVQGFINKVWKEHEMVQMLALFKKHDIQSHDWNRYRGYKENFESFQQEVFSYFEEMPVVHVTLYDANGKTLLSFNQSEILAPGALGIKSNEPMKSVKARQQAADGVSASNILESAKFRKPNGASQEGTLVQTVVPILSDNYVPLLAGAQGYDKKSNVEGAVEIYYDITRQWQQLSQFQYVGTGAILLIFLILITTLIIVASKAESIIAKQHESNLELAAQAAAAEAENENKSQFLASISHELRTPLNAIIGFSEIIKNETMGPLGNDQYKDYMRDIHNSGVHLLSLINDILDYSKAEAGKLDLNLEELDVTKLIHSSMRLVAPRAESAKVNLATAIPPEHYLITTDGKKLKQIMLNLLSNAVKFTPEEGEVKVSLWQDAIENRITVEVSDSGIGIAPKDISKALSPFGQVDSALSRKYEGTGLGLPLTKKFVEIMGGVFEIESEEGKGTKVRFSLPMTVSADVVKKAEKVAKDTDAKKSALIEEAAEKAEKVKQAIEAAPAEMASSAPSAMAETDAEATPKPPEPVAEETPAPQPPEPPQTAAPNPPEPEPFASPEPAAMESPQPPSAPTPPAAAEAPTPPAPMAMEEADAAPPEHTVPASSPAPMAMEEPEAAPLPQPAEPPSDSAENTPAPMASDDKAESSPFALGNSEEAPLSTPQAAAPAQQVQAPTTPSGGFSSNAFELAVEDKPESNNSGSGA